MKKKTSAKKKTNVAKKSVRGAKAAFIRASSRGLSAAEVVKNGAKRGLHFSADYVYSVRSAANRI